MTVHGIFLPKATMASNVDMLSRSAKIAADIDNGWVLQLLTLTGTSGENEVWAGTQASASAGLTHLWMADGEGLVLTDSKFKNIDPTIQSAFNASGKVFTCYKPQVDDIISLTAEAIGGTKSTNEFIVATASDYKLNWASAAVSGLSYKLIATDYLSNPSVGNIGDTQRQVIYRFKCVAIA